MLTQRFRDDGQTIYAFNKTFFVVCPICDKRATVLPLPQAANRQKAYRVSCLHCGFIKEWPLHHNIKGRLQWEKEQKSGKEHRQVSTKEFVSTAYLTNTYTIGFNRDWYFGLPLYLQTPCCGKTLWAYNVEHLNFLEAFIAADLRERVPNRNQSVASRLPRWMMLAQNREAVLQRIQRLQMRLSDE